MAKQHFSKAFSCILVLAAASALSGCATVSGQNLGAAAGPTCPGWQTVDSKPGQQWWAEQRWRYPSDDDARAAYARLAAGTSPWPDWFVPQKSTLAVGTRFEMAIGGGQTPDQPGRYGTFDDIRSAQDVYEHLAVRRAWKPRISAVVTYEVVKTLPVETGPVGPQVDGAVCALLPGQWSQFQMDLPDGALTMTYLHVVAVRSLP